MRDSSTSTVMPDAAPWPLCALGDSRSARGVLGQIRQRLAELARQRHQDDLAALFLCDVAQRT
ncbi:hypothetical protein [Ralstonia sp. SET104]|uniref:hypothetical protein n=1 Tax=Ralstonia sp. SET104 TaxID=2448774 RepID=UPI0021A9FC79|nr:hypothetical protein [Ralstonia sp. SET104]